MLKMIPTLSQNVQKKFNLKSKNSQKNLTDGCIGWCLNFVD
jgi:hypothetical protein